MPLDRQLKNRNFLQPTGFKFTLGKYPKVDFFSNTAQIPSINLGVAFQPTYLKDIPIPGDKLTYDDLVIDFLVDEESRLPSLNAIKIPNGVDDLAVRNQLLFDYNIEIGGGLGPFAGKVWRIGLMGHSAYEKNVDTFIYDEMVELEGYNYLENLDDVIEKTLVVLMYPIKATLMDKIQTVISKTNSTLYTPW